MAPQRIRPQVINSPNPPSRSICSLYFKGTLRRCWQSWEPWDIKWGTNSQNENNDSLLLTLLHNVCARKTKKKSNTPLTSFLLITIFPQSNNTVVKWTLKNPPQRRKCNMIFCAWSNWASCSSAGMNHCECVCPKQQNIRNTGFYVM